MTGIILDKLSVHIPVTPLLVLSLGAFIFAMWAIFSVIANYHWKNYGANKLEVIKMTLIYFVGSAILLAMIGVFAIIYIIPAN